MNWYVVDKKYVSYLQKFDKRVGYVEYGEKLKLHIGIIIGVDGFKYYIPVSSPKSKHAKMKNSVDFHKIIDPETKTLFAVFNINNMIPVPDSCVTQLKYNTIDKFRTFANEKEKTDYIYLLQNEKAVIDRLGNVLKIKAQKLLFKVCEDPESNLAKRCCNFRLLQEKSKEYCKQ